MYNYTCTVHVYCMTSHYCIVCLGNLHQAQYCDKVKSIVEFLGTSLSLDELSTIWDMQVGVVWVYHVLLIHFAHVILLYQVDKNPAQVENIHNILAYAASRFSAQHMDHLFQLIQKVCDTIIVYCTYIQCVHRLLKTCTCTNAVVTCTCI